jgi:hypothetical protein
MLNRDQVKEIQDININNPLLSKTLNLRALPRLAANRVIKTRRKTGITSVRQQL